MKITAGIWLIFRGLFFEPDIYPPLVERDWEKRPFMDRHNLVIDWPRLQALSQPCRGKALRPFAKTMPYLHYGY
jgi:hypothetical protein